MVFVILLGLHKNVNNCIIVVLVDKNGVDIAVELQLIFKGKDVQLLAGQAALAHGARVVGVQAAAHAEHSVLGIARLHAGDELGGLLHHIHFRLGVGAAGDLDALDHGANGLGIVALHKVLHLGQNDLEVGKLLRLALAGQHVGQFEGLVLCNLNLSHDIVHLFY